MTQSCRRATALLRGQQRLVLQTQTREAARPAPRRAGQLARPLAHVPPALPAPRLMVTEREARVGGRPGRLEAQAQARRAPPLTAPPLAAYVARKAEPAALLSFSIVVLVHLVAATSNNAARWETRLFLGTAAAHALVLALAAAAPRRYRALRLPILVASRFVNCEIGRASCRERV